MSTPFVPFTGTASLQEIETPAFEPTAIPDSRVSAPAVSPEKALADLSDAIRLGLDSEVLEHLLSSFAGGPTGRVESCPLPLRDLSLPVRERMPSSPERSPSIVVTRVGDLVQKVTVECPCGERISLDCVY